MNKDISKSPELLQKEERIISLTKQLKKKKSSLRGLKTKLNKLKERVDKVQKDIFREEVQNGERAKTLNKNIKNLLLEIKKWKKLSSDDLYLINDFLEQCNDFEEFNIMQEQDVADFLDSEEFERMHQERVTDVFEQFQEQPTKEEKRNIRKIFIGLSNRFHPDKAQNEKDRKAFHNIQQQINEAYKVNDIEKLIELEYHYIGGLETKIEQNTYGIDGLIRKLERDLDFITQQAKRTSIEIKNIRHSDLGKMVSEVTRLEKEGKGVPALFEEMHAGLESLDQLYNALQKCKKNRSIVPLYEEMERINEKMMQGDGEYDELDAKLDELSELEQLELLSLMTGQFDDDDDFDDDDFFEPTVQVKNPKFPIGSSVKIKNDVFIEDYLPWNLYDSQGRVVSAFKIGATIEYEIELDSLSLKSIPEEIKDLLFEDDPCFFVQEVSTSNLKKTKPKDDKVQAFCERRKIFHTRFWKFMDEEDEALMSKIMLAKASKNDEYNWKLYLNEHFDFPFKATTCTALNIQPNKEVEVLEIGDFDEFEGHKVLVEYKNKKLLYPMISLRIGVKKIDKLLKLYRVWFENFINLD